MRVTLRIPLIVETIRMRCLDEHGLPHLADIVACTAVLWQAARRLSRPSIAALSYVLHSLAQLCCICSPCGHTDLKPSMHHAGLADGRTTPCGHAIQITHTTRGMAVVGHRSPVFFGRTRKPSALFVRYRPASPTNGRPRNGRPGDHVHTSPLTRRLSCVNDFTQSRRRLEGRRRKVPRCGMPELRGGPWRRPKLDNTHSLTHPEA